MTSIASFLRLALLVLVPTTLAFPQIASFGLKGGVPVTDAVKSESWKGLRYYPSSGRYVLGPTVELHLPARLSIELDALYRPVKYRAEFGGASTKASGSAWEFPLLLKARLSPGMVSPYVAAGMSFNRLSGLKELGELSKSSANGWVFGLGLEGHLALVRISPEVRYTKWRSENLRNTAGGFGLSNLHQIEALVGITF
jgi:opacity protein-like surface antigen